MRAVSHPTLYRKTRERKYINAKERGAFLHQAKAMSDPLKRAFCLTLAYTGARISEVLDLRAADIDQNDQCIIFETLKQRDEFLPRALPVPDELLAELADLITELALKPNDLIWTFHYTTGYRAVKAEMKEIGVTGFRATPTGIRHGFAVECAVRGIPLTTIQTLLGHKRIETTRIYLGVMGEEARALVSRTWHTDA